MSPWRPWLPSVEQMVERSISAFVGRDAELAREVLAADDEVDAMRK